MADPLPNFLHLGPPKSGTTWLYQVLAGHPEVLLSPAKDLHFFNRCYDRGLDWYRAQFRSAGRGHRVIGEVCPRYLPSGQAPERIRACLGPDVRLMVTLREPVSRAFSAYLDHRKHGQAAATFRATTRLLPQLIDDGRYATHLRRYLQHFDRESLHVAVFDDLQASPQAFLDRVTDWLGIARHRLTPGQLEAQLPAGEARWLPLAKLVKHGASWARVHDGAGVVARIKHSALAQRALYRPLDGERPELPAEDIAFMHEQYDAEIAGVENDFGISLRQRWNWL
jgi:sulfotransferase family protein